MPDVRIRMAREPAGDSQREPQVPVVPWGKGTLSRQGQQRPRVKEAGRRQAARPRAERRPVRRGPPRPRRRHGVVARTVRPRLAREGEHALHARRRQLPVLQEPQAAARLQRTGHHTSRHSGDVAPAHEQALEAHQRAGHKPQARMVARRVRPRLPDGLLRQGEGQAGLLPVLFGEEETREADKARLAHGLSARKEWGEASVPPAYRRDLASIGLGGYAWQLWGPHRFRWLPGLRAHGGVRLDCLRARAGASSPSI